MSVNLCIDLGNSRAKAAIFTHGKITASEAFEEKELVSRITVLAGEYKPTAAIVCSVVHHEEQLMLTLRDLVKYVVKLDNHSRLPIMNAYHSPDSLGPDRLALVAGAHALYPEMNNLVISLGTCITYNFLQKNKAFRGGAIAPGLQMRLQALNHYTDKLPLVSAEGDLLLLGYDTETSIRSGVLNGMACEIDGMVQAFSAQYPDFNAVLTGGDTAVFDGKLKSKIFADPDILMKGLNLILNCNVPQIR